MKKLLTFILMFLLICTFTITAYAWAPSFDFSCTIDKDKIPSGTKYIDMLMPINEKDKYYVPFNTDNCKQFNIPKESEIVSYYEDGYRSYTFHISDAYSLMQPQVTYNFLVSEQEYNSHKELLRPYENRIETIADGPTINNGSACYTVPIYINSSEYQNFWNVFSKVKTNNFYEWTTTVKFNSNLYNRNNNSYYDSRDAACDYEYCRSTYKTVKFAYIDEEGNIIGVSNAAPIYKWSISETISDPQLYLQLTELKLNSNFLYGPALSILAVLIFMVAFIVGGIIVVLLVVIRYRKARTKRMETINKISEP